MVQFWRGPELGQELRAPGILQNRAFNANQLVKYEPSNFSSVKKEIWKGDRRAKFRVVSDSHNNNKDQLFPKHLHIFLETGDRHLQGWVQRWNGPAFLPWLWVFCSYKSERDSSWIFPDNATIYFKCNRGHSSLKEYNCCLWKQKKRQEAGDSKTYTHSAHS